MTKWWPDVSAVYSQCCSTVRAWNSSVKKSELISFTFWWDEDVICRVGAPRRAKLQLGNKEVWLGTLPLPLSHNIRRWKCLLFQAFHKTCLCNDQHHDLFFPLASSQISPHILIYFSMVGQRAGRPRLSSRRLSGCCNRMPMGAVVSSPSHDHHRRPHHPLEQPVSDCFEQAFNVYIIYVHSCL